jgi:hypothetical protein
MASGFQGGGPVGPDPRVEAGNWLDGQASHYSEFMFWLHLILCQCPGLLVGLLFVIGCRTSAGKAVGTRLLLFSFCGILIGIGINVLVAVLGAAAHR